MKNLFKRLFGVRAAGDVDLLTARVDELVAANQELGRATDKIREQRRAINAEIARRLSADVTVPGQVLDVKTEV